MKKIIIIVLLLNLVGCQKKEYETSPNFKNDVNVCYEIFPISFRDSNGDGHGDINGVTDSLTYLKETLNVDCIWLTPIHPSPSYHKYDVVDYYEIDPKLGTLDDYKNLLKEANELDISVLMDFVINHTSSKHPWFLDAKKSKDSKYRDYYRWNSLEDKEMYPSKDGWYKSGDEYYFASFWSEMPELNYENPKVKKEIKKIAKYWLEMGVDGFRIDAAKHVYDSKEYPSGSNTLQMNIKWFKEFNNYIKSVNKNAFLLGEVWNQNYIAANYLQGMDSVFNFELSDLIIGAIENGDAKQLRLRFQTLERDSKKNREDYIESIFLSNHDQNRVINQLSKDVVKAKAAANLLFTIPGISWIYYGEEIGMLGRKPDERIREPFLWGDSDIETTWESNTLNQDTNPVNEQLIDSDSILNHYSELSKLKKLFPQLRHGDMTETFTVGGKTLGYHLTYEGETITVIHNLGSRDIEYKLENVVFKTFENSEGIIPAFEMVIIKE